MGGPPSPDTCGTCGTSGTRGTRHRRRRLFMLCVCVGILAVTACVAVLAGAYQLHPADIWAVLYEKAGGTPELGLTRVTRITKVILWDIRLPRVLLAMASGTALAVAGAAYQACFRNPLVEPYILGVSSGAACGAALAILFPLIFPSTRFSAFAAALAAVGLTSFLARNRGATPPVALVLSGIIVGALFMAAVGVMKYLSAETQLREITFWMLGGFHYAGWVDAATVSVVVAPVTLCIWLLGWRLNVLSLGDDEAHALGVNPRPLRCFLLLAATLAAAVCVASSGIIAWVGLMAPHAARMLFGSDHRWLVPGSALLGAIYLLVCDTLARTLTSAEIPIGLLSATLGAPYLLWLLRTRGRELYAA